MFDFNKVQQQSVFQLRWIIHTPHCEWNLSKPEQQNYVRGEIFKAILAPQQILATQHTTHTTLWPTVSASPLWVPVRVSSLGVQPLLSSLLLHSLRLLCRLKAQLGLTNCTRQKTSNKTSRPVIFFPPTPPVSLTSLMTMLAKNECAA